MFVFMLSLNIVFVYVYLFDGRVEISGRHRKR